MIKNKRFKTKKIRRLLNSIKKNQLKSYYEISKGKIVFQWKAFEYMRLKKYVELTKSAKFGKLAPNVGLMSLDGRRLHLFDYIIQGRPLVINFGSST